jgi:hypothetical protein
MPSHWKVLACDLDGTLIGWDRKINERDLEALHLACSEAAHCDFFLTTTINSLNAPRRDPECSGSGC